MEIPKSVDKIVKWAADHHNQDVGKAVNAAFSKVKLLKEYPQLIETMVKQALQDWIHDERHKTNTQIKRDFGEYGGPAKVSPGRSPAVNRAATSVYLYAIAGTVLGEVYGRDLSIIADSEESVGNGYLFNARLCRQLARIVPRDKTVRESVTRKRLETIFRENKTDRGAT